VAAPREMPGTAGAVGLGVIAGRMASGHPATGTRFEPGEPHAALASECRAVSVPDAQRCSSAASRPAAAGAADPVRGGPKAPLV
jgi:hypothetical protein